MLHKLTSGIYRDLQRCHIFHLSLQQKRDKFPHAFYYTSNSTFAELHSQRR